MSRSPNPQSDWAKAHASGHCTTPVGRAADRDEKPENAPRQSSRAAGAACGQVGEHGAFFHVIGPTAAVSADAVKHRERKVLPLPLRYFVFQRRAPVDSRGHGAIAVDFSPAVPAHAAVVQFRVCACEASNDFQHDFRSCTGSVAPGARRADGVVRARRAPRRITYWDHVSDHLYKHKIRNRSPNG